MENITIGHGSRAAILAPDMAHQLHRSPAHAAYMFTHSPPQTSYREYKQHIILYYISIYPMHFIYRVKS